MSRARHVSLAIRATQTYTHRSSPIRNSNEFSTPCSVAEEKLFYFQKRDSQFGFPVPSDCSWSTPGFYNTFRHAARCRHRCKLSPDDCNVCFQQASSVLQSWVMITIANTFVFGWQNCVCYKLYPFRFIVALPSGKSGLSSTIINHDSPDYFF